MYVLVVVKFTFGFIAKTIPPNPLTVFTICLYGVLCVLGVLGLCLNTIWQKEPAVTIVITESQNITDQHFLNYFSLFVLFALTFELTKLSMFLVSLCIIVFVGIVYMNNQMFYINPLLNILGYNFYNITYHKPNDETCFTAKMFYKGQLDTSKQNTYQAKVKNKNFSFLETNSN